MSRTVTIRDWKERFQVEEIASQKSRQRESKECVWHTELSALSPAGWHPHARLVLGKFRQRECDQLLSVL